MILTKCAVCATELGLSLGKKCGRCSTRYCGAECQKQHWEGGGHDQLCKLIKKAGGAEQYNANNKYTEAVAVAAEACAEDTKGQTCYICTQALHLKTKEGLIRGCSCRGTAGFAHVSCLVEEAKILMDEAEYNNFDDERAQSRWFRWSECSLCEKKYHGVVLCALGWACWKTYLGRPEADKCRRYAMEWLSNGLGEVDRYEEQLGVLKAGLATERRLDVDERESLYTSFNLAICYDNLGQPEEALRLKYEAFGRSLKLRVRMEDLFHRAISLAHSLKRMKLHAEAKSLLEMQLPAALKAFGAEDDLYIRGRLTYGQILLDAVASRDDVAEAVAIYEEQCPTVRRIYGPAHPFTDQAQEGLRVARLKLSYFDAELGLLGMTI